MKQEICETCQNKKVLTKHHILPKRWYPESPLIFRLCRDCHTELEKTIPFEKQGSIIYIKGLIGFLEQKIKDKHRLLTITKKLVNDFIEYLNSQKGG